MKTHSTHAPVQASGEILGVQEAQTVQEPPGHVAGGAGMRPRAGGMRVQRSRCGQIGQSVQDEELPPSPSQTTSMVMLSLCGSRPDHSS